MNDEFKGKIISELVALRSKMYSLVDVDGKENKKQKESIMGLLGAQGIKNLLMFYLEENG